MRKFAFKKYLLLALFLFTLLSLSPLFVENIRAKTLVFISPLCKGAHKMTKQTTLLNEKKRLEAENHLLRLEVKKLKASLVAQEAGSPVVAASVIYRDPQSQLSSLWINVGTETNKKMKQQIVSKNSPVLYGAAVVGVIDFVSDRFSRVRLITDSGLKPSVRVERRGQNELSAKSEKWYLAKGILQGAYHPFWKGGEIQLIGTGFNYDFADEKGGARNLSEALIQEGDLLVTTGYDGLFPQGLKVAEVTKVSPLLVGATSYDIMAKPIIQNFDTLETLFVIPSLEFDL